MSVKNLIRSITPAPLLDLIQSRRRAWKSLANRRRSVQAVFSGIYEKGEWGINYSSGSGSSEASIVGPYVNAISAYLRSLNKNDVTIVDLGCGDFNVGRHFVELCHSYRGIDVVPELIRRHNAKGFGSHVTFQCIDIIEDPLPAGRICFVRQVFQHLSNTQIAKILPKLKIYDTVFVTEHYPSVPSSSPNLDKVHGPDIRLFSGSGVYLDMPPFNVPTEAIELFLEVRSPASGQKDAGLIRTFKIDISKT